MADRRGWIMFFDYKDVRYYFVKMFKNVGRAKFSTENFKLFSSAMECNEMVDPVGDCLLNHNVNNIPPITGKIKLMVANVVIKENKND